MNFWLQSSFVVYMLIGAVLAEGFQTNVILPTRIQRLDFGNLFFTSSSPTNCEQERTNCINKCTEENMLFYCSSLLTLVSTCTCITPPSISPYIQNESLRCKIARLQCLGTCGPNPNFQCQDSGAAISESCSCSDVSTEDNNIKSENNTFSSAEAISQVNSTIVDMIDGTDTNNSNTTNITVSNNDKSNEEDIEEFSDNDSVIKYENSDDSIAVARSTAIIQSSNKTEQVTETTTINKSVQKNEDDDDSDDEDDEEVEGEGNDEDDEDEEGEDQDSTLSGECEKAKADCQTKCKNLEIDFDCQSKGGAFSQSCACVSKSKDLSPSPSLSTPKTKSPTPTPTPSPTLTPTLQIAKVDEEADDPLNEVSRNNFILPDQNQVKNVALEPECEQAKKECETTCRNLEIDFDCQSNGGAFSQSCACVSKNKDISPSPSPSTPSPKSPTPTPTPDSSAKPPAPTPTPTPDSSAKPPAPTPTPTPAPTPSPKMVNNTSTAVAKSAVVVSTDTDMHALNTTLDTAKVDEAADEPLTEIQINNYAMDPECEQAKKECEKTCMDMEIDFDCKKVGINFSKSCACVSENVSASNVNAISDILDLQNEP